MKWEMCLVALDDYQVDVVVRIPVPLASLTEKVEGLTLAIDTLCEMLDDLMEGNGGR